VESHHDLISLFEHDLFGKPVPTFPDHAPSASGPNRPVGERAFNLLSGFEQAALKN
jgi:hypothetical protein